MNRSILLYRLLALSAVFLACNLPWQLFSQQAGTLDSTFGTNGLVFCETNYDPYESIISRMDAQERVLTLVDAFHDSGFVLVRNMMDGTVDSTFANMGTEVFNAGKPFDHCTLHLQQDNKILVAGSIQHLPEYAQNFKDLFLRRYLSNGVIDTSFADQGQLIIDLGSCEYPNAMSMQDDSLILVSGRTGYTFFGGGNTDVLLIRLLPDGVPDSSFGNEGIIQTDLTGSGNWDIDSGGPLIVQPDGKIVVAAKNGDWFNQIGFFSIIRYKYNGELDSSFANSGISIDSLAGTVSISNDIALQNDGFILVAGKDGDVFGGGFYFTLRRYSPSGQLDTSFANNGVYNSQQSYYLRSLKSIAIQSDSKIIVAGVWNDSLLLMRFMPQGIPDITFASNGMTINQFNSLECSANKIYLFPEEKITVLGSATNYTDINKVVMARFHAGEISNVIPAEPSAQYDALVYPNPATDFITIALSDHISTATLLITDLSGRTIYKTTAPANQKIIVYTNNFPAGTYLLQIHSSGLLSKKKIIILK